MLVQTHAASARLQSSLALNRSGHGEGPIACNSLCVTWEDGQVQIHDVRGCSHVGRCCRKPGVDAGDGVLRNLQEPCERYEGVPCYSDAVRMLLQVVPKGFLGKALTTAMENAVSGFLKDVLPKPVYMHCSCF